MCGSLGAADAADGGSTKPPGSSSACSRAVVAASSSLAGGEADRPHERRAGDADAGDVGGGGPAAGDVPVDLEGLGEHVAEEPEPGDPDGVAVAVGLDVEDLDVEQVA